MPFCVVFNQVEFMKNELAEGPHGESIGCQCEHPRALADLAGVATEFGKIS